MTAMFELLDSLLCAKLSLVRVLYKSNLGRAETGRPEELCSAAVFREGGVSNGIASPVVLVSECLAGFNQPEEAGDAVLVCLVDEVVEVISSGFNKFVSD